MRVAYDFTFGALYLRPYGDLDLIYTNTPGFHEAGLAGYALNVHGASKTNVAISPTLEFGGRYDLDKNTILRPFVSFGFNFLPNNTRAVEANFIGASASDGTFATYMNSPSFLANLDVGMQIYNEHGWELRAEYMLHEGGGLVSQTAAGRVAYHF